MLVGMHGLDQHGGIRIMKKRGVRIFGLENYVVEWNCIEE